MALKARLTKDDLAKLPDALKAEYKADGDAFVLDVTPDGDLSLHDSSKLKKALEAERGVTNELRKAAAAYEGIDAAAAREALSNAALYKTGADDRTKAIEAKYKGEVEAAKGAHEKDRATFLKYVKTRGVEAAITGAKGNGKLLAPHVLPLVGVAEKDGEYELFIADEKGTPRVTNAQGASGNMTVAEYLASLRSDDAFKGAFYSDQKPGNGSPAGGGGGGAGGPTYDPKDPKSVMDNFDAVADGKALPKT